MSYTLEFFNLSNNNFDSTDAFREYCTEHFYSDCFQRAKKLVGEDGNVDAAFPI